MSNIVTVLTAAEIANNRFVNINAEGKAILATTTNPANGFCMVGGAIDTLVQVFMEGSVPAPLEGLAGRVVYLGADGVATMTAAAGRQQVGYLTNGDRMIISIKPKPETSEGGGWTLAVLASDVINNNASANTLEDLTGLSVPVVSGSTYYFKFSVKYTAELTTTGSRWTLVGPTFSDLTARSIYSLAATTQTLNTVNAYGLPAASNATSANTEGNYAIIEGWITPTADGNVIIRFASEVSNRAITAKAGSFVEYRQLS